MPVVVDRITMFHPDLPGVTRAVARAQYRSVWWAEGWRSDDDPDYAGPEAPPPEFNIFAGSVGVATIGGVVADDVQEALEALAAGGVGGGGGGGDYVTPAELDAEIAAATANMATDSELASGLAGKAATGHGHASLSFAAGSVVGAERIVANDTLTAVHVATVPAVSGASLVLSVRLDGVQFALVTVAAGQDDAAVTGLSQAVTAGQVLSAVVTSGSHTGTVKLTAIPQTVGAQSLVAGSAVGVERIPADDTLTAVQVATIPAVSGANLVLSVRLDGTQFTTVTVPVGQDDAVVSGLSQAATAGQVLSAVVTSGSHTGTVQLTVLAVTSQTVGAQSYVAGSAVGVERIPADHTLAAVHVATVPAVAGADLVLSVRLNGTQFTTVTVPAGQDDAAVTGLSQAATAGQVLSAVVASGSHTGIVQLTVLPQEA